MAQNAMWGWPRYTSDATLSGGSWNANYPITNLKDDTELAKVGRTADASTSSAVILGVFTALGY